jgi:hypothetical protein
MNDYERNALREHAEHHYGEAHTDEPSTLKLALLGVAGFAVTYALLFLAFLL